MRLALLALLACSPDKVDDTAADTGRGPAAYVPPGERGPYTPATYESALTPDHGVELAVQAWYPTEEPLDGEYRYDEVLLGTAREGGAPACATPRPVVVFSHGNSGIRWQSVFFTEHLASRGWVVVAPDHTGNTALDLDADRLAEMVFRRPVDVAAAFDWLLAEAAPRGPLEGCVDPAAGYAVVGHSFGGYTTLAVAGAVIDPETVLPYCEATGDWLCDEVEQHFTDHPVELTDLSDARVWAAVPMTPAGMGALAGGLDRVEVPLLMWGGGRDTLTTMAFQVQPLFDGLDQTPRHLAEVVDAGHYTFSDACQFLPTYPDCRAPFRDPADVHALVNEATTAFLDLHRGEEAAAAYFPVEDAGTRWESYD
jgi:predicted dienelactone hydrolase